MCLLIVQIGRGFEGEETDEESCERVRTPDIYHRLRCESLFFCNFEYFIIQLSL